MIKKIRSGVSVAIWILLLFLASTHTTRAQKFFGAPYQHVHDEKCGAVWIEKEQEALMGVQGSPEFFETWMQGEIQKLQNNPEALRTLSDGRRIIPVVVHVIHNGEPVGQGANIPFSQIESQIRILTEDFTRTNPDTVNTPAEFRSVAANVGIEFILAKQDPDGLPTDGINRVQGPRGSYGINDRMLLASLSSWPPEDYLNVWVVPLNSPLLGFASFPVSNLPGLNFAPTPREADGITVDFRFFGVGGSALDGLAGRTATHEVGHFLGLRHIWGDGNCDVDDFVADTPNQDGFNAACRINNPRFTCGSRDMTENYMDYTVDACMNIFTLGQKERMDVVLMNSPRRVTLVNGRATQEPELNPNSLTPLNLIEPLDFICELTVTPAVEVVNNGNNVVSSAVVELRNNGSLLQRQTVSLNLATGERALLSFNPITLAAQNNNFELAIVQVNGQMNGSALATQLRSAPRLQGEISLPYTFEFEDLESGLWQIINPDEAITWIDTVVTIDGTPTRLFKMNNFEYDARGQQDFIVSPQIDLEAFPNAQLTFNLAHGPFPGAQFADELIVAISQDCGNNFDLAGAPYFKNETFIQTVPPAESPFVPVSAGQFRREIVNLAPFASLGKVRVAIINRNGFGNNIFIKDLEILAEEQFRYDLGITELVAPNPIAAPGGNGNEVLAVENTGNLPISGFLLERQVTNNPRQTFIVRGQALPVGGINLLNLPLSPTIEGTNSFRYQLLNPNFDQNPAPPINFQQFAIFSSTTMETPWRQNFNGSIALAPWLTVNPERNNTVWRVEPSPVGDGNNQLVLRNTRDGDSYWVGSPIFDLSQARFASLFFRRGAGPVDLTTRLRVLISQDGGLNYAPLLELDGETLSTTASDLPNRNNPGDFVREFINLNDFTGGNNNRLRVAFALESANADNPPIFLDDIELFLSDNPNPVDPGLNSTRLYPNPARDVFSLAFNFLNFEDVFVQVVSTTGQVVYEQSFPNTLNQTYSFTTALFSKGVFVVKITSRSLSETKKLIIQ